MRVSVIIPLFNKAPFIERRCAPSRPRRFADFEIIVVDDGSTDGGLTIVANVTDARLVSSGRKCLAGSSSKSWSGAKPR